MNFVSTPKNVNKSEVLNDIKQFNRRIKSKSHFGDLPKEGLYFKSTSNWLPTNTHHTVKTFVEDFTQKVENSLETEISNRANGKNLSKEELKALDSLRNREDLVSRKAD